MTWKIEVIKYKGHVHQNSNSTHQLTCMRLVVSGSTMLWWAPQPHAVSCKLHIEYLYLYSYVRLRCVGGYVLFCATLLWRLITLPLLRLWEIFCILYVHTIPIYRILVCDSPFCKYPISSSLRFSSTDRGHFESNYASLHCPGGHPMLMPNVLGDIMHYYVHHKSLCLQMCKIRTRSDIR